MEDAGWKKTSELRGRALFLFSQFLFTYENSTERMHEGIQGICGTAGEAEPSWDIALLTATNPPMYDNNCPDWELPDLVRKYNEEGHEWKIRIVTRKCSGHILWNGLENFRNTEETGAISGTLGRKRGQRRTGCPSGRACFGKCGVLECLNGQSGSRVKAVREEAEKKCLLYDEHTWGASQAISDPHDYESQSQYIHK